ncbi:MAG: hypothetical protein KAX78_12360 [Phycisphaerae bacterium]|nr:hypothetical protein [Phycisphaerae bacterium]
MRKALLPVLVLSMAGGCQFVGPSGRRGVSFEISGREGSWRMEGVQTATLELSGWEVRIVESAVNDMPTIPRLEKLVLEIVNTSSDLPLVLDPSEIGLTRLDGGLVFLGPDRSVVLPQNGSHRLLYSPGIRAGSLSYPFILQVTVFRGLGLKDPQSARLILY